MPRRDWNTPKAHTQNRHHKPMKSGRHGKGHDAWLRMRKRIVAESCGYCHKPVDKKRKRTTPA